MATTEHTINDALALVLRHSRRAWRDAGVIRSENTGMLRGAAHRPDILVLEPYVSPVVIETEVVPAATVEPEARSRLGSHVALSGRAILSSIALRVPKRFRLLDGADLARELLTATDYEMAVYTGSSPDSASRWPRNRWITGNIADLSILTQAAAVPPEVIDRAADELIAGIRAAAGLLAEVSVSHPGAIAKIGEELRQESGEQTLRMAAAILANAFVFHESLAGGPGALRDVRSLEELKGSWSLTKAGLLAEWSKILSVNYWSIFDIARRLLEHTPGVASRAIVETLAVTAARLLEHRLMRSHDLTGAVFQRLIADRKFLAAYYTTPPSAALLASLAINEKQTPSGDKWSAGDALRHLRVADFACGTGTLLSAAYQRIGQFHELAGGDAQDLHRSMMGGSLVGCDVLPAAAHLTAASLSSVHPTETYTESSIITLAYGRLPDGEVALGSWDLMDAQRRFEILAITAKAAQGTGEVTLEPWSSLPHNGFDLVIMNPPFTRPTGHESDKIGVRNPMFAAFQTDDETQKLMAKAAAKLSAGTNYHGNAGEASLFVALADRKLKEGGTLAMVLPLSFMLGDSWAETRALVTRNYSDLILVTNAGVGGTDVSFSSDTGMAECLLVGVKRKSGARRATFVTLNERPDTTMSGTNIAVQIQKAIETGFLRKVEDGPVGGSPITLGSELVGQAIGAALPAGWNLARVRDFTLAQMLHALIDGRLLFPGMAKSDRTNLKMTSIGALAVIGPYHADINGRTARGGIRGPFDKLPVQSGSVPTYPVLWEHNADLERTMLFEAEAECIPRLSCNDAEQSLIDSKVESLWATASQSHFNVNFQFNSQSTAMQFTPRRTIGGRAWLSMKLKSVDHEKALVLWGNTSLGLLIHWWHSNRQQIGRGNIGKNMLVSMPVLDIDALSPSILKRASAIFDTFSADPMLPINELHQDSVRKQIDEAVMTEVLGLPLALHRPDGPMDLLRRKLASEPSIIGGKRSA
ncbi:hypothetical protein EET67_23300 [Pseudaminobacter arsenicus]|uniref:Site-specific DNA-methyltransferase (adenine-specific) n=1 Tax=Borborobacter arsenicus TaxID=1851146 RepID=A0A432UZN0_9HYPH|nr:hypothetical protein [Pseudaminobacter arsenicus]RUM95414.1 hypothetical protein EET67_23300 [Pseudaminobacter arsenicus]